MLTGPGADGSRLRSVDCLRGVAALGVLAAHAALYGNLSADRLPKAPVWFQDFIFVCSGGRLGVPLFFVISGFCIHLGWAKRRAVSKCVNSDFLAFWRRRMRRLYLPYLAALTFSVSLVLIAISRKMSTPLLNYPEPRHWWILGDFAAHALMLHGLIPKFDHMGGNPALWTLAREEYLYMLYFVLLPIRRVFDSAISTVFSLAIGLSFFGVMRVVLSPTSVWWPIVLTSALCLWIQWSLGMLAAESYFGLYRLPSIFLRLRYVLFWGLLAELSERYAIVLSPLAWGLCFFTLVNCFVEAEKQGRWPKSGWSSRVVNWLSGIGLFSYSLYLVHYPLRGVVKYMLPRLVDTSSPFVYLSTVGIIVAVGLAGGKLFFLLIEKHFLSSNGQKAAMRVANSQRKIVTEVGASAG
jgi:peptidoglycan/LPS O-acetylase OafA/YrhL